MSNPLKAVREHGQSIWLDNLSRQMLEDGSLEKLIKEDGVSGVTSNPAIFEKAITKGEAYDKQLKALQEKGLSAEEMYERVAVKDIQSACDLLRPAHEDANGTDGFVSLEVNPHLARDTRGTVNEAVRLWEAVSRPNVMIKIPGTPEGVPAIRECLTRGININITLLFSLKAYDDVMEAHLAAMEERLEEGHATAPVASVASFFLSRIDVMVDKMLDQTDHSKAKELRGEAAVASAKLAYQQWKERYSGERWEGLAERGARVQKPLWASTSTKDDAYSDVKYVEPLIGPQTVNTLPDETVDAFRDHGKVATTVENDVDHAKKVMEGLNQVGIDIDDVTDKLVEEGIEKFVKPFDSLLDSLKEKSKALASGVTVPRDWVLWDGDCGFCRRWALWMERRDTTGRFRVVPYQDAPSPPMTSELRKRCANALHVITAEGRELAAGRALLYILDGVDQPGPWRLAAKPPMVWLVELGYRIVAANRGRLGFLAPSRAPDGARNRAPRKDD